MQFQITFTSMHYGYEKQKETAMFGCLKIYLISLKYRITYIQNQFKSYLHSLFFKIEIHFLFWTEQNF